MPSPASTWKTVGAALIVAMVGVAVGAAVSASQSSASLSVSGGSLATVRFTVTHAGGDDVIASPFAATSGEASGEVCYALGGEIVVSSNVTYDLLVSGRAAAPGLRFVPGTPADFDECAGGEPIAETMFAARDAPGSWATHQPRTGGRAHAFTLALLAEAGAEPSAELIASSVTILARAAD